MPGEEKTYDSPPSRPTDAFWLGQGQKMVETSLPAMREAAKAMMTALGVLEGIYVAILGFGELSKKLAGAWLLVFALPLVAWMVALCYCLCVMMTSAHTIGLLAPESIRENHETVLKVKQKQLWYAFAALAIGLILALIAIAAGPHAAGASKAAT